MIDRVNKQLLASALNTHQCIDKNRNKNGLNKQIYRQIFIFISLKNSLRMLT
jgi:hypothetical protein